MKRLLLASVAAAMLVPGAGAWAADMAVKAPPPPPPPPPAFSWSGFYIGGNVGGGWITAPSVDSFAGNIGAAGGDGSFIGGGQVGFNWQFSPYGVFGGEFFIDGFSNNNNNSIIFTGPLGNTLEASAQANWIATATARLGVTAPIWDRWLLYAKGGAGWLNSQAALTNLTTGGSVGTSQTRDGWVFGVGIEWAFAPNWTGKIEWQYLGLNDFTVGPGVLGDSLTVRNASVNTLTFGINYLFNWGGGYPAPPVVSRY
jgi:outer membrane immunogenic protein